MRDKKTFVEWNNKQVKIGDVVLLKYIEEHKERVGKKMDNKWFEVTGVSNTNRLVVRNLTGLNRVILEQHIVDAKKMHEVPEFEQIQPWGLITKHF